MRWSHSCQLWGPWCQFPMSCQGWKWCATRNPISSCLYSRLMGHDMEACETYLKLHVAWGEIAEDLDWWWPQWQDAMVTAHDPRTTCYEPQSGKLKLCLSLFALSSASIQFVVYPVPRNKNLGNFLWTGFMTPATALPRFGSDLMELVIEADNEGNPSWVVM